MSGEVPLPSLDGDLTCTHVTFVTKGEFAKRLKDFEFGVTVIRRRELGWIIPKTNTLQIQTSHQINATSKLTGYASTMIGVPFDRVLALYREESNENSSPVIESRGIVKHRALFETEFFGSTSVTILRNVGKLYSFDHARVAEIAFIENPESTNAVSQKQLLVQIIEVGGRVEEEGRTANNEAERCLIDYDIFLPYQINEKLLLSILTLLILQISIYVYKETKKEEKERKIKKNIKEQERKETERKRIRKNSGEESRSHVTGLEKGRVKVKASLVADRPRSTISDSKEKLKKERKVLPFLLDHSDCDQAMPGIRRDAPPRDSNPVPESNISNVVRKCEFGMVEERFQISLNVRRLRVFIESEFHRSWPREPVAGSQTHFSFISCCVSKRPVGDAAQSERGFSDIVLARNFHGVRIEPQFSITDAQGRSLAALSQHMRSAGSIWATMDPNP
ncbi:hypothetical protein V1477_018346 [Vespula maculifrons]|uniref:Uncharacterized protein n=1 Tax=Vespula maculifrons TaxID=7453 RepID=A0ABD2AZ63_VESMC